MLMNVLHSFQKHALTSLALAGLLSLAACGGGGGGGGGGGALPKKVTVEFPTVDAAITDASADFEIAFASGVTDASSLEVLLNSVDVTMLFTPSTGVSNRTASVYSLSGMLKEGSSNCITVKMAGSSNSGACFTYDPKPEIILTTLSGSGAFTASGVTRLATLASVTLNTILAESITAPVPAANSFSRTFTTMPPVVTGVTDTAHFTLTATDADGDVATGVAGENNIKLIVPESVIKYGAGLQFNNAAFNVIETWVGELMENELGAVFDEFEANPHPSSDLTPSGGYDDTGLDPLLVIGAESDCLFINSVDDINAVDCKLFVTNIDTSGGAVTTDVKAVNSGVDDDKFLLEVAVTFADLKVTIDNAAFSGGGENYAGALVSTLGYSNAKFTFKVEVSRTTGKIVGLTLPVSPYTLALGNATVTGSNCNLCSLNSAQMNINLGSISSAGATTLQNQIIAELQSTLTPELEEILADAFVEDTNIIYPVVNAADKQISSLIFGLSGSVVNEAKTTAVSAPAGCDAGTKVCGGFIGLGGTNYADDSNKDVSVLTSDIPALGSYFDPLAATSVVKNNFINATDHVMIALSENSLNQLLLSTYQSRLFSTQSVIFPVSDLEELGDEIIALTASTNRSVDANDLVSINFDLRAVPYASLDTAGLELRLNALNVVVKLHYDCSGDTVSTCKELYKSELNLDAKMLMGFGLLNGLPEVSIDDTGINIVGVDPTAVVNTFIDPTGTPLIDNAIRAEVNKQINKNTMLSLIPGILNTYISGFVANLVEPIVQDVDLAGVGLFDKSAWLVLQTLGVDAQKEFIMLTATVVDVDPMLGIPAKQGIFRLNITDSYCDVETVPVDCPNYVAPAP